MIVLSCKNTSTAAVRSSDGVVVQRFSIKGLPIGLFGGRAGHPWNAGKTSGRSPGQRRAATLQQELSVVNDPGTFQFEEEDDHQNRQRIRRIRDHTCIIGPHNLS